MMNNVQFTRQDDERVVTINALIPGWSDSKHYAFFKGLLADLPWLQDLLIVGVYQGRDIAYILDIVSRYHPGRRLRIVGVDKFSNTPCDDWPEEKRALDWKAAGFGEAPTVARAWINLHRFIERVRENVTVTLIPSDDAEYLATTAHEFDFVYLDTDHTEKTVTRQLGQVLRVTRGPALIAGDDYSNDGTWGVKTAVEEAFEHHSVFANWIWFSERRQLKKATVTL
jgi:hypothetical protein